MDGVEAAATLVAAAGHGEGQKDAFDASSAGAADVRRLASGTMFCVRFACVTKTSSYQARSDVSFREDVLSTLVYIDSQSGTDRLLASFAEGDVRGADVGGGEDADERRSCGCGFDVGAATLFAVDEAEDSGDVHACFAGGFDGRDGAAAGGADVVDDDDLRSLFEEAFDLAAGAVGLLGFADEEALQELRCRVGGIEALLEGVPRAGAGGVGDERVGSHGEAADGFGLREMLADEVVEDQAGEAAAFGVEGGGAAVDVVVGLLAAGEGEVAQLEGEGRDEVEQGGAVVRCRRVVIVIVMGWP